MRYGFCVALVVLAGCASTDEQLLLDAGIPDSVTERLPQGVPQSAVGLQDGCYLYDDPNGQVVFVTDESGNRICVEQES